jgi:hypothetical protein
MRQAMMKCLSAVCVALMGCAATTTPNPEPPPKFPDEVPSRSYRFLFVPEKEVDSIDVTIGLISPVFDLKVDGGSEDHRTPEMMTAFSTIGDTYKKAIEGDFNATLIAKGFGVTGPYISADQMTYGEKRTTNLVLLSKIVLNVHFEDREMREFSKIGDGKETDQRVGNHRLYMTDVFYEIPGSLATSGFVELTLFEPLSWQKIWTKKIEVAFEQRD